MYFTKEGIPQRTKVFLICGAPASGKSTYVNEHKKNGDLVVDLDNIRQALGAPDKTSEMFTDLVLKVRKVIYKEISDEKINCENIWVISGLPNALERERTANSLNAEIIFINTSYDECIRRAEFDDSRKDKVVQRKIIYKYFKRLT